MRSNANTMLPAAKSLEFLPGSARGDVVERILHPLQPPAETRTAEGASTKTKQQENPMTMPNPQNVRMK
jgi:hypothetical protein